MKLMCRVFGSLGLIVVTCFGSAVVRGADVPFRVELVQLSWDNPTPLPQLQSYAAGMGTDGRWLLLCGRTAGLHGFAGTDGTAPLSGNFAYTAMNPYAYVVDPVKQTVTGRVLHELLSDDVAATLMVTNSQFCQSGSQLVICGGYGYTSNQKGMLTQPLATVIDIDPMIDAVVNGTSGAAAVRQTKSNVLFQVAGGELLQQNGTFYLVFGQNFPGFYTPDTNGKYTFQTRWFQLDTSVNPVAVTASGSAGGSDTPEFRRRDLNVVPALRPDGKWGLTAYGGVFTLNNSAWQKPVYIDPIAGGVTMALDPASFQQQMNQYSSATLAVFNPADNSMSTVIFGGIGLVSYDPRLKKFFSDPQVPFVKQVSCIVRDNRGASQEFLLLDANGRPLEYPCLQGPEAKLLPAAAARELFQDDVLNLKLITGRTLIGYVFGGIASTKPNRGNTTATNTVFEVYLTPESAAALPVSLTQ